MNINDFISPFDVLDADNWQTSNALHADVSIVLPNSFLLGIWGGFDLAPVITPVFLQIFSGATKVFELPITQDGPFPPITFKPAPAAVDDGNLTVRLKDGGAGITGYLNVAAVPLAPVNPVFVQQIAGAADDDTLIVTLPDNVGAGSSVFVWLATVEPTALTVSLGTSGEMTQYSLGRGLAMSLWYLHNVTGGAGDKTITITSAISQPLVCNAAEFTGVKNQAPSASASNTGNSANVSTNPIMPLAAKTLLLACGSWGVDGGGDLYLSGPTNGFTRLTPDGIADSLFIEAAYRINTASANYSTGWGLRTVAPWSAAIVAFDGL